MPTDVDVYPRRARLGLIEARDAEAGRAGRNRYPRRARLGLIEARSVGRCMREIAAVSEACAPRPH